MSKYRLLLQRPKVSAWVYFSTRLKYLLYCATFVGLVWLAIYIAGKNSRLSMIYNLQASIGDMLDYEWKHLPKVNGSDGWKETSIPQGHIYSAYLDTRPEQILQEQQFANGNETAWGMVRIIAILSYETAEEPLTCVYKYKKKRSRDENSFILSRKKAIGLKQVAEGEDFDMSYGVFFILCELTVPENMNYEEFYLNPHLPYEITVVPDNGTKVEPKNDSFVPVFYSENGISMAEYSNHFMAVCIPVLHHNFDRVRNLIEFMEFYQMMGATHFTFYNRSMSSRVGHVLEYYRDKGVVTILPWELPPYFVFEKTLRVDGIFAALNDCLYRSSFYKSYMYVAGVDVDEYIVPRKHKDFLELMEHLDPLGPSQPLNIQASFIFRNMFFYTMFEDDPITPSPEIPRLYSQSKTLRWSEANPGGERSKYIVRSKQTVELGNHHTWELRKTASVYPRRYKEVTVDLEVAASHHYRACETNAETCWLRPIVRDRTAHRFTDELGHRVAAVCKEIFEGTCPEDINGGTRP